MINSLLLLEKKLAAWTRLDADAQQDQANIDEVAGLAGDTSAEFLRNLEQCTVPEMLSLKFNRYHHKAVRLINQHPWSEPIQGALHRLLDELEDGQSNLLDEERLLPRHERDALRAIVDRDLPAICTAIERRGLPAAYCHEIRCAFRNLFDDTRLPELTYRHRAYVPLLLNQGLTLAADRQSSRWNHRLLELFVNHNLNYMGIFERWKDRREAEFAEADKKGGLEACLHRWEQTVSHYNPKPGMVFDPHNESLHSHMRRYIEQWAEWFRFDKERGGTAAQTRLFSKLVGTDLRVRFHYFCQTDYDYEALKDAANDYAGVHVTRRGETISPRQLLKFDKEKLYGSARKFRRLLLAIIKRLDADFGFKNTDF